MQLASSRPSAHHHCLSFITIVAAIGVVERMGMSHDPAGDWAGDHHVGLGR